MSSKFKLFSLKPATNEPSKAEGSSQPIKKSIRRNAAEIRLQKDLADLSLADTTTINFNDPNDLLNFNIAIKPDQGFYKDGTFPFTFAFKESYPHDPPKVKCTKKIYHPNIDLEGNVCLNILREDWNPVNTVNSIIFGLQYILLEPNAEDPLNKEAAEDLRRDSVKFEQLVKKTMSGSVVNGIRFDKVK